MHLDGFVTFASHWHLAYTVQAMEKGLDWEPPFKPVMKAVGINSAMMMDFHRDGHPADLTELGSANSTVSTRLAGRGLAGTSC